MASTSSQLLPLLLQLPSLGVFRVRLVGVWNHPVWWKVSLAMIPPKPTILCSHDSPDRHTATLVLPSPGCLGQWVLMATSPAPLATSSALSHRLPALPEAELVLVGTFGFDFASWRQAAPAPTLSCKMEGGGLCRGSRRG